MVRGVLAVALVGLATGCDTVEGTVPGRSDVALDVLFAPPTSAELAAVERATFAPSLPVAGVQVEGTFALDGGGELRVLSHLVDGERHVGALAIPPDAQGPLAVVISASGYGPPFELPLDGVRADAEGRAITLFPSFRGTTVRYGDARWTSGGDRADQCDGAARDLIAFLDVVLATEPRADAGRVVAAGGSRGGNVALVAAVRDDRIRGVASLAGPTDFLVPSFPEHPNLSVLYREGFLRGLIAGTETVGQARAAMLACSPAYWVERLPRAQVHHGLADRQVPPDQARRLQARRDAAGLDDDRIAFVYHPGAGHRFEGVIESVNRQVSAFLSEILYPGG